MIITSLFLVHITISESRSKALKHGWMEYVDLFVLYILGATRGHGNLPRRVKRENDIDYIR